MSKSDVDAEFEAAWNELDDDNTPNPEPTDVDPEPVDDTDPEPEEIPEPEPLDEPEPEPEPAPEPEPEIDYKAAFLKAQQDLKTANGRLRAVADEMKQSRRETPPAPAPAPGVEPSEDDKFLEKFRADYNDDVLRAVEIITARKANELIAREVLPRIDPVQRTAVELMETAHFSAIEAAHPDVYDIDESPEFDAWIAAKPIHLRGAYEFVREKGTPGEVIAMLDEYKQSVRPRPTPPPPQRVEAATAVVRRRGTTPVSPGPAMDDFEAAWREAPE